jgi:2,3-diketo-5-methylthio-1-phosphopentane phosphatase
LVSDFDGTLARPDFYQLVRRRLVPAGIADYWQKYRSGLITHFDALNCYFDAAHGGERDWRDITRSMQLPDDLPARLKQLRDAGWETVVVSAGCTWYIDILLERARVQIPVLANPGRLVDGHLVMERPVDSPFYSRETGIDKAAFVTHLRQAGQTVAFAGDGFTDLAPSRLVDAGLRFARSDLAAACREQKLDFQPFDGWTEVVDHLVGQPM